MRGAAPCIKDRQRLKVRQLQSVTSRAAGGVDLCQLPTAQANFADKENRAEPPIGLFVNLLPIFDEERLMQSARLRCQRRTSDRLAGLAPKSEPGSVAKKAQPEKDHTISALWACACLKRAFEFQSVV